MDHTGIIFNVQRFSIHDGPGIRTTVFVKGCPLKCKWCSNPESQNRERQLMVRLSRCVGCGACASACPEQAVTIDHNHRARMNWHKCRHCFSCIDACLYGAREIAGREVNVADLMTELMSDLVFYQTSAGGVTVSGGEPLGQSRFVEALLRACKQEGLHTAIETSGYGSGKAADRIARYLDLILFDIKQLNPVKHRRYTLVDNGRILDNLRRFAERVEVWFRIPLVKGVNDSIEHVSAVADLAVKLGIRKISLLPYHEGGVNKAAQIGARYQMPHARPPDAEHLQALALLVEKQNIQVAIGR